MFFAFEEEQFEQALDDLVLDALAGVLRPTDQAMRIERVRRNADRIEAKTECPRPLRPPRCCGKARAPVRCRRTSRRDRSRSLPSRRQGRIELERPPIHLDIDLPLMAFNAFSNRFLPMKHQGT
jgi:hypothetical protein